jgi:hypothetical protein
VIAPLLHAVPLALGAAISPALVGVTVELLATGGSRRRAEVLAYLLGGTAVLLGIGVLGNTTAGPAIRRTRLVGLGVAMMVTNISTILLTLGALREIARAHIGPLGETAALLVLVGVAMTPVWLPLCVDVAAPQAVARVLEPIARIMTRHGTVLAASVSALFGVYLLIRSSTAF